MQAAPPASDCLDQVVVKVGQLAHVCQLIQHVGCFRLGLKKQRPTTDHLVASVSKEAANNHKLADLPLDRRDGLLDRLDGVALDQHHVRQLAGNTTDPEPPIHLLGGNRCAQLYRRRGRMAIHLQHQGELPVPPSEAHGGIEREVKTDSTDGSSGLQQGSLQRLAHALRLAHGTQQKMQTAGTGQ
jgi:hypothetical protein